MTMATINGSSRMSRPVEGTDSTSRAVGASSGRGGSRRGLEGTRAASDWEDAARSTCVALRASGTVGLLMKRIKTTISRRWTGMSFGFGRTCWAEVSWWALDWVGSVFRTVVVLRARLACIQCYGALGVEILASWAWRGIVGWRRRRASSSRCTSQGNRAT